MSKVSTYGGEREPGFEVADDFGIPPAPDVDAGDVYEAAHPAIGVAAFLLAAASLWQREIVRFVRQPGRLIGALGVPIVFWLIIGSGLGRSFQPPTNGGPAASGGASGFGATGSLSSLFWSRASAAGTSADAAGSASRMIDGDSHYLAYFYPGSIALILLFTAIFSTISVIEDRREGFLQGVLVSPAPRGALVLGKVAGGATIATLQGLLFLFAAPLLGFALHPLGAVEMLGAMFLVAAGLTALGFVIAWQSESTQGYHSAMNLLLMPMWLLSGALFPAAGADRWIRLAMAVNPMTYGVALMRHVLLRAGGGGAEAGDAAAMAIGPSLRESLLVSLGFAVLFFAISWFVAQRSKVRAY